MDGSGKLQRGCAKIRNCMAAEMQATNRMAANHSISPRSICRQGHARRRRHDRRAAHAASNAAPGSGAMIVARNALSGPPCQTKVAGDCLKESVMVVSGSPTIQFHVPSVLETQLK